MKRYERNDLSETELQESKQFGFELPEYWHENPEFGFVPLSRFIRLVCNSSFRSIRTYATFATLPKNYNFRHIKFATFMLIYIFIANQATQLVWN